MRRAVLVDLVWLMARAVARHAGRSFTGDLAWLFARAVARRAARGGRP